MANKPLMDKSSPLADIRPVLKAKYRTLNEAAEDIGIHISVLSNIFRWKISGISYAALEKVCIKLELDKDKAISMLSLAKKERLKKRKGL